MKLRPMHGYALVRVAEGEHSTVAAVNKDTASAWKQGDQVHPKHLEGGEVVAGARIIIDGEAYYICQAPPP